MGGRRGRHRRTMGVTVRYFHGAAGHAGAGKPGGVRFDGAQRSSTARRRCRDPAVNRVLTTREQGIGPVTVPGSPGWKPEDSGHENHPAVHATRRHVISRFSPRSHGTWEDMRPGVPRLPPGASCAVRACEAESKTGERAPSKGVRQARRAGLPPAGGGPPGKNRTMRCFANRQPPTLKGEAEPPAAPGPEGRVETSGRRPARQKSHDAMFCQQTARHPHSATMRPSAARAA